MSRCSVSTCAEEGTCQFGVAIVFEEMESFDGMLCRFHALALREIVQPKAVVASGIDFVAAEFAKIVDQQFKEDPSTSMIKVSLDRKRFGL